MPEDSGGPATVKRWPLPERWLRCLRDRLDHYSAFAIFDLDQLAEVVYWDMVVAVIPRAGVAHQPATWVVSVDAPEMPTDVG